MFGAMAKNTCLCIVSLAMFAACHTPPPRSWMRYELDGGTEWSQLGAGKFGGSYFGANVSIDLYNPDTRVLVVVENSGPQPVQFAIGPEAGSTNDAIGEVLLRQVAGASDGGPPMRSYVAKQALTIESGWRATFYLDRPLGRDPKLGQYFVLGTEIRGAGEDGASESVRRFLPVVAKLGGTIPVKPQ